MQGVGFMFLELEMKYRTFVNSEIISAAKRVKSSLSRSTEKEQTGSRIRSEGSDPSFEAESIHVYSSC